MKGFLLRLLIFLLAAAALGYLLYPVLYDQYSQGQRMPAIEKFFSQVQALNDTGKEAVLKEWKEENARVRQNPEADRNRLQTFSGMLAVLEIPEIDVRLPVYPEADGEALRDGAALKAGSALPVGGDGVQTVLVGADGRLAEGELGYFGLLDAQLLHRLDRLKPGSILYLYTPVAVQTFQVQAVGQADESMPAAEENASGGEETPAAWLTVMTEDGGKWAVGKLLAFPRDAVILAAADGTRVPPDWINVLAIGSPVLLVGFVFMILVELIRRHHYRLPSDLKKRGKKQKNAEKSEG